jgi:hypothetical protein
MPVRIWGKGIGYDKSIVAGCRHLDGHAVEGIAAVQVGTLDDKGGRIVDAGDRIGGQRVTECAGRGPDIGGGAADPQLSGMNRTIDIIVFFCADDGAWPEGDCKGKGTIIGGAEGVTDLQGIFSADDGTGDRFRGGWIVKTCCRRPVINIAGSIVALQGYREADTDFFIWRSIKDRNGLDADRDGILLDTLIGIGEGEGIPGRGVGPCDGCGTGWII